MSNNTFFIILILFLAWFVSAYFSYSKGEQIKELQKQIKQDSIVISFLESQIDSLQK